MLEMRNVTKVFNPGTPNEVRAIEGVDLTLEEGAFVVIIGTNGSGNPHCSMPWLALSFLMREPFRWMVLTSLAGPSIVARA